MQKKDDKVGNKTTKSKSKKKSKKRVRERKIEIDSRMREKQKKLFNYVRLVGKYAFFLQNSFLAILMLLSRRIV